MRALLLGTVAMLLIACQLATHCLLVGNWSSSTMLAEDWFP